MLKVYGQNITLNIQIQEDKNLYIDIDNRSISELTILDLPPVNTYIITTRQLADFDSFILQGYFNVLSVDKPSCITEALISNFISQSYEENSLKVASLRLLECYKKSGTVIQDLKASLVALKDDDFKTFGSLMSIRLLDFIDELTNINDMISFCKSLQESQKAYSSALVDSQRLSSALAEVEKYRSLYESVKTGVSLENTELIDLRAQVEELSARLNAHTISKSDIINSIEYKQLEAKLKVIEEEKASISSEYEEYKRGVAEDMSATGQAGLEDLNTQLRNELRKLRERKFIDSVADKLPIFTTATHLAAEKVLCIKEVRPTVYINGLISWFSTSLKMYSKIKNKKTLVLVVDPLTNYFEEMKYRKHGWNIGEISPDMAVLITPPLGFDVLKNKFQIDTYDFILCIDRCHTLKPIFDMPKAITYYLINNCSDIVDFHLDGASCIAFLDEIPPIANRSTDNAPKYHIPTWSHTLCTTDFKQRTGKFAEDRVFIELLTECGVYWK